MYVASPMSHSHRSPIREHSRSTTAGRAALHKRYERALVLGFTAALLASHAYGQPGRSIATVVAERLALMPEVAKVKWNAQRPVEDLEREQALVEATLANVDPVLRPRAERAIRAQIDASKMVQTTLFEQWRAHGQGPFARVRDLDTALRPAIGRLTVELIDKLDSACDTSAPPMVAPPRMHDAAFRVALAGIDCTEPASRRADGS